MCNKNKHNAWVMKTQALKTVEKILTKSKIYVDWIDLSIHPFINNIIIISLHRISISACTRMSMMHHMYRMCSLLIIIEAKIIAYKPIYTHPNEFKMHFNPSLFRVWFACFHTHIQGMIKHLLRLLWLCILLLLTFRLVALEQIIALMLKYRFFLHFPPRRYTNIR